MTDEHHHDWPLVHHQSARLQNCCMKPLQSLFFLILAPSQLAACGFTAQILTYPTCFQIFKQKKDCSQSKFGSFEPPLQPQWINVCLTCTKQRKLKHCNGEVDFYFLIMQPRSQSSSAISDVTSPVKLVGKIRARFQASSGHSDSANRPGYEAAHYAIKQNNVHRFVV